MSINSFRHRSNKLVSKVSSTFSFVFGFIGLKRKKHLVGSLDEKLVYSMSGSRIPTIKQLGYLGKYLNKTERLVLNVSLLILSVSVISLFGSFYFKHLELVPVQGGEYVEGVVGIPKYVNPLYSSINDVDSDLVGLIYSSLYRHDNKGNLVNDLVETASTSPDGKTYTIKIKQNVKWHNGSTLTSNDVLFTFNSIKDQQYRSPLRISFSGVDAEVSDDQTIIFKLKEAYAGFPELLTFGILPQDLWGQLAPSAVSLAELNLKPIGSGPYKFKSLLKDKNGNLKSYNLELNTDYYNKRPFIEKVVLKFYPSYEEAVPDLNSNAIDGLAYFPAQTGNLTGDKSYLNYNKLSVPQIKDIFFNTKAPILADKKIRQALALAIDKKAIIDKLLSNKAQLIDGPIAENKITYPANYKRYTYNQEEAQKLIESAGWKLVSITADDLQKAEKNKNSSDSKLKQEADNYTALGLGKWYYKGGNYLIVKLSTVDSQENPQIAQEVKAAWEFIHVKTIAELVPPSQIQSDVIKTRDYEALLSGEVLSGDIDPYPFWHSSQIGNEGLNLSNYSNKEVDKLLEAGRQQIDMNKRVEIYQKFLSIISDDEPAIFMYSPYYIYAINNKVKNVDIQAIVSPSDRLMDINQWYIETGKRFKR